MIQGIKMLSKQAWHPLLLALVTSIALLALQVAGPARVAA